MSRILITSCKGGVGKSTVAVGVAVALTELSRRVLLIDFDLGNPSLDLMLGLENDTLYNICDVVSGKVGMDAAIHLHPEHPNLAFIGAPFRYAGDANAERFSKVLDDLEATYGFDYILVDTSGGAHESVTIAAPACDRALIVSSQNPTSIRAAGKSGMLLDEMHVGEQFLIVNCFDTQKESFAKRAGVLEMIDRTRTPLIGILPTDARVALLAEAGKSVFDDKKTNCRTAFMNIAKRICGEHIPLMQGFTGIRREQFLFR